MSPQPLGVASVDLITDGLHQVSLLNTSRRLLKSPRPTVAAGESSLRSIHVPDKRSRILEVVIVRRIYLTWVLGIWSGEGMRRIEKGEVSLRVT